MTMPNFQPCSVSLAQLLLFACGCVGGPFFPRATIFMRRLCEFWVLEQDARVLVVSGKALFVPVKDNQLKDVVLRPALAVTAVEESAHPLEHAMYT